MFRLLMNAVSQGMGVLEGKPGCQIFTHNIQLLEEKKYMMAGKFVAWSLVQGGPGLPTLHPPLYKLMCGIKCADFGEVNNIPDTDTRLKVSKIANCQTPEDYKKLSEELGDWACDQGVMHLYDGNFKDKDSVVSSLLKHYYFYRTQSEIVQFMDGLGDLSTIRIFQK